jgi:CLIP-associating protein 1/2
VTDRDDAARLSDAIAHLLKDNNFKVCSGALHAASLAVAAAPDVFRPHVPLFLPGVFDRLGDLKAPVRDAGRDLLVALMAYRVVPPSDLVGKPSAAWGHKNWRVREETLRVVERAFGELDREIESGEVQLSARATLPVVVAALEDREAAVREAAVAAVVAMAPSTGREMHHLLAKHTIRPGQLKEIQARLAGMDLGDGLADHLGSGGARTESRGGSRGSDRDGGSREGARPATGSAALRRAGSGGSGGGSGAFGAATVSGLGLASGSGSGSGSGFGSRPSTTGGGSRSLLGLASAEEGPPPYGRATGRVARIAEGAPPRPAHVDSERELSHEIDKAAAKLDPSREWTDRIAAMVRVEALLAGGAAEWESFPAQLAKLRAPLTAQVADRRSSIVRQAAHLLVILAAELGGEFEREATHFVPELFKCVVITVQIIAESGDFGVRGILHNCQARHLIPKLCEAASKDRSVKLRCQATGWLRLVVREWDSFGGARNHDAVESAILSMVADGSPDVRSGARALFSAYASRWPENAEPLTRRIDAGTRRLIAQESASGAHDDDRHESPTLLGVTAEQRAATAVGGRRPATIRTTRTRERAGGSAPTTPAETRGGSGHASGRGSYGYGSGSGGREVGAATLRRAESADAARASAARSAAERADRVGAVKGGLGAPARRVASSSATGGGGSHSRAAATSATTTNARTTAASSSSNHSSKPSDSDDANARRGPPTIASFLLDAALASDPRRPSSWEAKTRLFEDLSVAIRVGGRPAADDAASKAGRVADVFAAHLDDPHHRVAHAALDAMVEFVPVAGASLEPELERLCPLLFPRLVDAKESVRQAASAALAAVGDAHPADALLPALLESLDASKAPRAKTGVLEFALYVLSGQGGGTDPTGRGRAPATAGGAALRRWVARVAPLAADKHGPLRAAAAAGLAAVHARADPTVVLRHLVGVSAAEAAETCRAVAPHAPSIEAEFHAFAASERRGAERREKASRAVAHDRYAMASAGYAEDEDEAEEAENRAEDRAAEAEVEASSSEDERAEVMRSTEAENYYKSREVVAASMERLDATRAAAEAAEAAANAAEFHAAAKDSPSVSAAAAAARASASAPSRREDPASFALSEALAGLAGAGSSARPRALAAVRRALRGGASLAPDHAGQILAVSLEALASSDATAELRTHALFTLRDLAQCAPAAFAPHAGLALPRILDALDDPEDPDVALSAGDALDGVVDALDPAAALHAVAPHVGEGGAAPVRCLGGVVTRMEPDELMRCTPELIPGLVRAFNSTSADVRKAVVDALVAMYDALGDWLLPQLGGLTPAQQKLVTIYINRAMEKPNAASRAKAGGAETRVPLAPRQMQ